MRYHHQNLTDGRLPLWRHGRAWLGKLHWEWSVFYRPRFRLAVGSRHLTISLLAFSLWIVWNNGDEFERREFAISAHDGNIWIEHPWVRQMEWRSSDPWWRKQIVLPVTDWMLGKMQYSRSEKPLPDVFVPMPEGCYRAKAEAVHREWWRRFGWFHRVEDGVDLSVADGGIPFAGKGENSWDCGDDGLWGWGGSSVDGAIANGVASVLRSRAKCGYDSNGTGREPAIVVNDAAKKETP